MTEKEKELHDSILYYTGGSYHPDVEGNPQLRALAKRLEESGFRADWFCYYVCTQYAAEQGELESAFVNKYLIQPGRLASEEVWRRFTEYLKTRADSVRTRMEIQRDNLRSFQKVYGDGLDVVRRNIIPLNAVMRLDYALGLHFEKGLDVSDVLQRYEEQAEMLWKGCPEYLEYCLHLRAYLKSKGCQDAGMPKHHRPAGV